MDSANHVFAAPSAGAHWNPALRANSESVDDHDDDFFERYPGPTPKKNADGAEAMLPEDLDEPSSPIRRQSISVQQEVQVTESEATEEELQRVPSHHVEISARPVSAFYEEDDEEALRKDEEIPILSPEGTAAEQDQALEAHMPDDEIGQTGRVESAHWKKGESAAEHYEHQGEITEMEEALQQSESVSLLRNEEPLPIVGLASRTATMASDTQPPTAASALPLRPQFERAFTSNFSDSPVDAPPPSRSVPDAWPSVGDDQTFAELLHSSRTMPLDREAFANRAAEEASTIAAPDSERSPEQTKNQVLEATAAEEAQTIAAPDWDLLPEDEGEVKEEDLAAAWGAALDDDDMLEETPTDLDPSHFFGEDDDGFLLEDEPAPAQPAPTAMQQQQNTVPSQQYRPANIQTTIAQQPQTMPSPQFFNPSGHGRSAGTPSTGLHDVHGYFGASQQPAQQRPAVSQQAQSFSDKAKGGYQSPYDLPMEVVKPRRRPQQQQSSQAAPVPPPRSTSISSHTGPPPISQPGLNNASSAAALSPPSSRGSITSGGIPVPAPASAKSTPKSSSGFFEELPMVPKPRARPAGAYTPQASPVIPTPPVQAVSISPPRGQGQHQSFPASGAIPTPPMSQQSSVYGGLRQPEKLPLLPDQPNVPVPQQPQAPVHQGPPANTRYSPSSQPPSVPLTQNRNTSAPIHTRYSPAPTAQPIQAKARQPSMPSNATYGMQQANPFAPRTSSPLAAFSDKPHPPLPIEQAGARGVSSVSPSKISGMQMTPPDSGPTSRYSPAENRGRESPQNFGPALQRPPAYSPDATMKQARSIKPTATDMPYASQTTLETKRPALPHRRRFSRESIFAAPQDERAHDPLQRWQGHPVFKWSASGMILSTFPKQTPFYAAGQSGPAIKCTPGPISVQDATHFLPLSERNAKFPGPLQARAKGRKKEVLSWMTSKIEDLEQQSKDPVMNFSLPVDLKKRAEEKIVLWKIMRLFVEHDGVLDGNQKIAEELRGILLPNLAQMAQVAELQSPSSSVVERDAVDKHVTLQLRQALLEGKREQAVWLAEEKRLWGHAMLIASTMGPETWKQIAQAFVRNQVKSFGSDARSLAALYQVFAGNSEECVDELVPPSARAGFQMISLADGNKTTDPLEGLDQWRETLSLVTSNRTSTDGASLVAIGKMLAGYGRVEAAHSCFLFARTLVKHSGPDDAESDFVLLGANHQAKDENFGGDLDSIILSEIYEYSASLTASTTSAPYIPHLQAFKLIHSQELAAYGLKSKAQTYCDAVSSAYTSTTRPSPYYHPAFTQAVAEMSAFLSQTPLDGKSGFLSRPALNKVSSSATNWLTKFVTGDDDQASNGSGPGGPGSDSGPFGGVNGDSGTISREGSGTDLYSQGFGNVSNPAIPQPFAPSSAPSRYTPGAVASAFKPVPAQPYSPMVMPATEPQRPGSSRYAPAPAGGSSLGFPAQELTKKPSNYSLPNVLDSRRGSGQDASSVGSYEPRPTLADDSSAYGYLPQVYPPAQASAVSSPLVLAQHAPAPQDPVDTIPTANGLTEPLSIEDPVPDAETQGGYELPTGGYEPPSYTYQPYEPEPDSPEEAKPKRMYGDEDEDTEVEKKAAALKKAQADREADELFRKAAEADAAKDNDKAGGNKKGWFGGWWGGNREGSLTPGPIKAKLGEENSFYFDKDLGKWVNKKGGAEAATAATLTPPPPRGPASRAISATMGPPPGPPSRNASGTALANLSRPPTSGSGPAFSGPPSRTGTPGSNPDAGPTSAPSGMNGDSPALSAVPPPMRPASTLSTASSIDDLLAGPPGPRKAGGTVKKKKGGRYVDVMAK